MADKLTPSDVKGMFEKLSNWGRWGKEDQRGALNSFVAAIVSHEPSERWQHRDR